MTSPRISIVTPSLNQAGFVEAAMRSVLDQEYPDLEYVVIDGGSTDGTVDIIRRFADRLTYWVSEPDEGQYDAINKGFARTSGEIMAWLNSDDKYTPWAFDVVGEVFSLFPEVEWITTLFPLLWDERGRAVWCSERRGYSREGFLRGEHLPGRCHATLDYIQQESTFWRRSLWDRAGGRLDASVRLAADFELWARFYQHGELHGVGTPLGGFRFHETQKTATQLDQYAKEALQALRRHGGRPYGRLGAFVRWQLARCLPGRLGPLAIKLGLLLPRPVCLHAGRQGGWKLAVR